MVTIGPQAGAAGTRRPLCRGAGGARMWIEECVGKRIKLDRVNEALDTGAEKIVTPRPRVILSGGLSTRHDDQRGEHAGVDVPQMLLAGDKR